MLEVLPAQETVDVAEAVVVGVGQLDCLPSLVKCGEAQALPLIALIRDGDQPFCLGRIPWSVVAVR